MSFNLLRKFIQEEIGRNQQSVHSDPYTFSDLPDYNVEISGATLSGFYLTVEYQNEKIAPVAAYKSYEEAKHASRMIIDNDRVKRMNS